jgi:hypothetical protein
VPSSSGPELQALGNLVDVVDSSGNVLHHGIDGSRVEPWIGTPRRSWRRLWRRPAPTTPFWQTDVNVPPDKIIITTPAVRQRMYKAMIAIKGEQDDLLVRDLIYAPGWSSALRWLEAREQQRNDAAEAAREWPWPKR